MKLLLLLVSVLILLGGCASPSQLPQPTPTPETKPSPTPPAPSPPPEPSPLPQPPELPHYEITLVSFSGFLEGVHTGRTQLFFSGEVRNDSPVELQAVDVVITSYKENNDIVAIDKWRTFPWVIKPGETSQFGVRTTNYINAVRYEVSFEHLKPGILDLSTEPGVSKVFLMSY